MGKKAKGLKKGKGPKAAKRMAKASAGKGLPPYDEAMQYSCEDDPYRGHRKPVRVEFLALDLKVCDRCQGADKRVEAAVDRCRDVLGACGYDIDLSITVVANEWMAEEYRFYSSPTIRVNGVDICPSIEENDCGCCSDMSDSPVKCRLYPFNGTYYEVPPTDMVVQEIMRIALSGKHADPQRKPYRLPANFASFFEGVRRKTAAQTREGQDCCQPGCC